jgi:hypothetical protein
MQFTQTDAMPMGAGSAFQGSYVYGASNPFRSQILPGRHALKGAVQAAVLSANPSVVSRPPAERCSFINSSGGYGELPVSVRFDLGCAEAFLSESATKMVRTADVCSYIDAVRFGKPSRRLLRPVGLTFPPTTNNAPIPGSCRPLRLLWNLAPRRGAPRSGCNLPKPIRRRNRRRPRGTHGRRIRATSDNTNTPKPASSAQRHAVLASFDG